MAGWVSCCPVSRRVFANRTWGASGTLGSIAQSLRGEARQATRRPSTERPFLFSRPRTRVLSFPLAGPRAEILPPLGRRQQRFEVALAAAGRQQIRHQLARHRHRRTVRGRTRARRLPAASRCSAAPAWTPRSASFANACCAASTTARAGFCPPTPESAFLTACRAPAPRPLRPRIRHPCRVGGARCNGFRHVILCFWTR